MFCQLILPLAYMVSPSFWPKEPWVLTPLPPTPHHLTMCVHAPWASVHSIGLISQRVASSHPCDNRGLAYFQEGWEQGLWLLCG